MSKVVVTGGCGFIGSHLVETLCQQHEVIVIDNLQSGYRSHIESFIQHNNVKLINTDIQHTDALKEYLQNVESVFHLAANISVPESIKQPVKYFETNCMGTLKLLMACCEANVKNFVFSSSAAVYGDNPINPKREGMLPEPQSPYAVTKLDGEFCGQFYAKEYGINFSVLRYFNVFGPRQIPRSAYASVIPLFINQALQNKTITIFGDGEQTRDFVFVKDIVQANILAAAHPGNVFNVANGESMTINDLAYLIIELTHSKSKIDYQPPRHGDITHSSGDNTKIRQHLNFQSNYSFNSALAETIHYYADKLHERVHNSCI